MGIIYLITNDINDLKYVGLTTRSLEIRWKEHKRHKSQKIDEAINQYGAEHFQIQELEQCSDELLDEREIYWIKYYDSFNHGYNVTPGGRDDKLILNYDKQQEVKALWNEGLGQKQIQQRTKLNVETVHNYLLKTGITAEDIRQRANYYVGKAKSKPILQFDLDNNFIQEWPSIISIERAGIAKKDCIRKCCQHKQTQGKGYIWRYKDECNDN